MAYAYNVTFVVGAVTCSYLLYDEIFMFTIFFLTESFKLKPSHYSV